MHWVSVHPSTTLRSGMAHLGNAPIASICSTTNGTVRDALLASTAATVTTSATVLTVVHVMQHVASIVLLDRTTMGPGGTAAPLRIK